MRLARGDEMQFDQLNGASSSRCSAARRCVAAAARAQQPAKLPTIGFLGTSDASAGPLARRFVQRLRELGWIEGRTVAIEFRWAEGRSERFAEIAAEFVRLKVDVIVTSGGAVPAAKQATSVIPIVFAIAATRLQGSGRKSRATGWQRHRPFGPVDRFCRQAARALARGCPGSAPVGDHGQCRLSRRRAGDGRSSGGGRQAGLDAATSEIRRAEDIAPAFDALKGRADALYVCADAFGSPTGFASTPWRSARDCRRFTASGNTSTREV